MARRNLNEVPGSPHPDSHNIERTFARPIHPAALLAATALIGSGLALTRSSLGLACFALGLAVLALRAEAGRLRGEMPLLALATVVFLAQGLFSGRPAQDAWRGAALIALRLLALLYLLRWAARAYLERAARWVLSRPIPVEPRPLFLILESGRHALALTPLALREASQQHEALRARGLSAASGFFGRARYAAVWLLPFLGTMLRLGESYEEALAARGYVPGAPRRSNLVLHWGLPEALVILGGAAAAVWLLRVV